MAKINKAKTSPKHQQVKKSAYKVVIDKDKCKACELCICYCPTKHLKFSSFLNKRGLRPVEVNPETKCIGCGFCYLMCPESCIEVYEQ